MEALDRYLQSVKKHLPWQRQDDIIAELRANLEAQLEDKETGLGRALTAGEVEAWLKQMGPPMQVAARYQPQQYLIGPAFFPTYWFVLRTAAFWAIIIYSIVSTVEIFTGLASGTAVLGALLHLPGILLTTAAWVTLVFAAIEVAVTHNPSKNAAMAAHFVGWVPTHVPTLEKEVAPGKKPRSYANALAEVIFGFLFLGWLLLVPQHPYLLMGPGAAYLNAPPYQLGPVWVSVFWSIVGLNLLLLGWRCLDLGRGSWQRSRPAQHITIKLLGLIPLLLLLTVRDHASVTLKHPALDQLRYGGTLDLINHALYRGLLWVFAIAVLQLSWEIGRTILNDYRKRAAAMR